MILRPYQQSAVDAAWRALQAKQNPVIQLPTGSGKSLVLAELAKRVVMAGGRVLIATHVAELVSQNAAEFLQFTGIEPGILCAGLARTDKHHNVLFASVQSLYRPAKRGEIEGFNLILIDEAHLCAEIKSTAKFYPAIFKCFSTAQRCGLSATPWRTDGPIYGEGRYFSDLCYQIDVLNLVHQGFLAPLVGVNAALTLDTSKFKIQAGDFATKSVEDAETDSWLMSVVDNVKKLAEKRKHIAVFCPSVKVAERAAEIFTNFEMPASHVVGDTEDRSGRLNDWRSGKYRVMCSVNVLSTGFNFRALDCIVCIRPTTSLSWWVQCLGRGTRISEGKTNCLVIDYSGNLALHGGICAGIEESYSESKSGSFDRVSAKPIEKNKRKTKTVDELTSLDPMLSSPGGLRCNVTGVNYVVLPSKSQIGKKLLMVNYDCQAPGGALVNASEFVCCEYEGFPRVKAEQWFKRRGGFLPDSADKAQTICWGLPSPREINVKKNGKFYNVVKEFF